MGARPLHKGGNYRLTINWSSSSSTQQQQQQAAVEQLRSQQRVSDNLSSVSFERTAPRSVLPIVPIPLWAHDLCRRTVCAQAAVHVRHCFHVI
jgi:hypothetical protein